jgi:DNA-binding SARP family transcriptional activator/TolB-like protein
MIRLRVLGALDLRNSEGQELRAVLSQPKRAALLVYLALARPRGPHRRDSLLALFWPEQDTEHARNALSQAIHFLRRSLGPEALMAGNGEGLGLHWKDFWCDAVAFEEALDEGRPADAIDLYRGELLEGFHVSDAPDFERWLDTERARLGDRYAQAMESVAMEREEVADYDGAIRLWRRLAARDPYNSRTALRLMRALAASGDPAAAVQHARLHERSLREELDVAPDSEILAFAGQLQSARPEIARPETSKAPVAEPSVTSGRDPAVPRGVPRRRRALVASGLIVLLVAVGSAVALRTGARDIPPIRSLAVLPLASFSGDSTDQFFADGLHDALIAELARYPQLKVISRTSVMQYRETRKPLPDIARELKVDAVIEGTLLRDGGRVRMNAQLVHGPTDRHLWAKRYERDLRDVLLLQAELAQAIAQEVRAAASPVASRLGKAEGPRDSAPSALYLKELYLRGRRAEIARSPIGAQTARQYFNRAIEQDDRFAPGYAGLAGVYAIMAEYDLAPTGPALDSAHMMARRAVEMDSSLSEGRAALGFVLGSLGEFDAAEREFRRAVDLGPNDARAHSWYSVLLVALGRGEEALQEAQRATDLDPFGPAGQLGMVRLATWLVTGTRPHLKIPVAERMPILKVEPGEPWSLARQAYDYATEGQCAEAGEAIGRARPLASESFRMLALAASTDWICGKRRSARALLDTMKRQSDAHDHGFSIALVHTTFGEKDSALMWIPRTRWTVGQLASLSADRRMDPLRSDPRFHELLLRLGLRRPS